MTKIMPISDLNNSASVDIPDQEGDERAKALLWLMSELKKGTDSIESEGGVPEEDIKQFFKEKHKDD